MRKPIWIQALCHIMPFVSELVGPNKEESRKDRNMSRKVSEAQSLKRSRDMREAQANRLRFQTAMCPKDPKLKD